MIFWVELLPKLSKLITELACETHDPLWCAQGAEWRDRAHSFISPDTALQIDLKITNSNGDSNWGTRYEDAGGSDRAIFGGMRSFVLNLQCKGYDPEFHKWAVVYAERILSNLQRDETLERLESEFSVNFYEYGSINDVSGVEDGHALTVANLDLFGYAGFSDDPKTAALVPRFTSIVFSSKLDGYTAGQPPNIVNAVVPEPPLT